MIILNFKASFPLVQSSTFVHFNIKSYRSDNNKKISFSKSAHIDLSYPEMDSTKTFTGDQKKLHNAHAFLRLIAVHNVHNVHLGIANFGTS